MIGKIPRLPATPICDMVSGPAITTALRTMWFGRLLRGIERVTIHKWPRKTGLTTWLNSRLKGKRSLKMTWSGHWSTHIVGTILLTRCIPTPVIRTRLESENAFSAIPCIVKRGFIRTLFCHLVPQNAVYSGKKLKKQLKTVCYKPAEDTCEKPLTLKRLTAKAK